MPKSALDFDIRGGRSKELSLPDQNAQRLEQVGHSLTIKTGWSIKSRGCCDRILRSCCNARIRGCG